MGAMTNRKDEHIKLALDEKSVGNANTFDEYVLEPFALSELSFETVDTSTEFLGKTQKMPLIVSSMTGGATDAERINRKLAEGANKLSIPFCTGSMSPLLKGEDVTKDYDMKKLLPNSLFFLNISVLTIRDTAKLEATLEWIERLQADGIVVHLNVLQELIQPEGERDFSGSITALKKIRELYSGLIIVKEVGVGIDEKSATILETIGVDAIECGGQGGTSWSWIEGERGKDIRGESFKDFGLPTATILSDLRDAKLPIIGSGGIRNGLDVAKVIALGGTLAGMARALLVAAMEADERSIDDIFSRIEKELKTAMVACGAVDIDALKHIRIRSRQAT